MASSSLPRILIVVVNYRTPALTLRCAESLSKTLHDANGAHLVIVDNGSGDALFESLATLLRASESLAGLRTRIHLLRREENGGFAAGTNEAIRSSLASATPPDYFWLLNSDTLVCPHALARLVAAMESNPRLGIAGSRMIRPNGTVQRSAFRFPTITGEFEANVQWSWISRVCARSVIALAPPDEDTRVDWVSGGSMLLRRLVPEQIGLLDESFFMYFEDVDYCRRAARAGWETWHIPSSRVEHSIGGTSKVNSTLAVRERMPEYWFAARHLYFYKYHGNPYTACADAMWLLGYGMRRVRQFLLHKPAMDPPRLGRDFLIHALKGNRTAAVQRFLR